MLHRYDGDRRATERVSESKVCDDGKEKPQNANILRAKIEEVDSFDSILSKGILLSYRAVIDTSRVSAMANHRS
jgi:hypothetical protein